MRHLFAFAVTALALAVGTPVRAEKLQVEVTRESIGQIEGLAIYAVQRDDGTIGFHVYRDPSKAERQGRDGLLEISDGQGAAVETYVRGEKKGDQIEYWFAVAPRHIEGAVFTLEVPTATNPDGAEEAILGGGTFYRFRLSDFDDQVEIACPAAPDEGAANVAVEGPIVAADAESLRRRSAPIATDIDESRDEVRASLVLHEHDAKYGASVQSVGVEFENLSIGRYARVAFDPASLNLELLDADGGVVALAPSQGGGPQPQAQVAIIPPGGYVTFSSLYPGVGIFHGDRRLLAGDRTWGTPPGDYRLTGSISAPTSLGAVVFDDARPGIALPPVSWPAERQIPMTFPDAKFSID